MNQLHVFNIESIDELIEELEQEIAYLVELRMVDRIDWREYQDKRTALSFGITQLELDKKMLNEKESSNGC